MDPITLFLLAIVCSGAVAALATIAWRALRSLAEAVYESAKRVGRVVKVIASVFWGWVVDSVLGAVNPLLPLARNLFPAAVAVDRNGNAIEAARVEEINSLSDIDDREIRRTVERSNYWESAYQV
jgi:hypothetical protein